MAWFQKKEKVNLVYHYQAEKIKITHGDRPIAMAYLRDFIELIRPEKYKLETAEIRLQEVGQLMQEDITVVENIRHAIYITLRKANLVPMLTDSGMALSRSVGKELISRIKHKFIPALKDEKDFLQVIDAVFYKKDDYQWVERIPGKQWNFLLSMLNVSLRGSEKMLGEQVLISMEILSARVAQLGWEKEISDHLSPDPFKQDNPFMLQQMNIHALKGLIGEKDINALKEKAGEAKKSLDLCQQKIEIIRENTNDRGASLSQTFILYQLEQKLSRLSLLLDIIDADEKINSNSMADYFIKVIRNENRKNSIREVLSQTTGYLAYQIAEQKGKKGNAYITTSPAEFRKMILSAMKGGFIVCFMVIIKSFLGLLKFAPFWQGFVYSLNYSAGFVLIEQTHSTLATKQPAFTANAVAGSIDSRGNEESPKLYNLAVTLSKVSRSQFASFVGNLIVVFPGTYLFVWLLDIAFGFKIAEGEKAMELLQAQHPWQSLSLLYACNTGIFLFLSGIIAGYVQNKMKFGRIGERIVQHPALRFYFSRQRLQKIAKFWEYNAGSIVGSVSLGFFLGMASIVGKIFGFPFDIRHITIAAGNISIGLYGVGWEMISKSYLLIVFLGVMGIGFLNFMVSFSLAFYVALRSRGLRAKAYPEFLGILWRYFKSHPLDFIRPRKRISHGNNEEET
ncbi:MAG: site-specific recombinase [Chitinophagaceae bacterium]